MDWRTLCGEKLVALEQAPGVIQPIISDFFRNRRNDHG